MSQIPNASAPLSPLAEDEIDLRELWDTIWKNKWFIVILSSVITIVTIFYAMTLPNVYRTSTVLIPQGEAKPSMASGLGALAGLAGIDLGGGQINVGDQLSIILSDKTFVEHLVREHKLYERFQSDQTDPNLRFALGVRFFYDAVNFGGGKEVNFTELSATEQSELIFDTVQEMQKILKVETSKQTSAITLSAEHPDATLAHQLVSLFLEASTEHLRTVEMADIDQKINFYNQEIARTPEITLKNQLSQLVSALIQKKVLSQASEHYQLRQITQPVVSHPKDKVKPKRALMVVVAMVTGGILSIFIVFLREFIRNAKTPQYQQA
ncbi:Wzz/FepE/Etk N-terminal domain-containing protein [Chrysiogenes arsenatis]|uniref:Wzz/FepE/Etk N-terminal domain-containing protein n=1 Tax=Chrysiogenes arsenatis TaxID=309797 RepID=UPI00042156BE|nr:Wzz/FepE/Etk N-terminal domain-containing protein [Chrysiogenes arsenatis]